MYFWGFIDMITIIHKSENFWAARKSLSRINDFISIELKIFKYIYIFFLSYLKRGQIMDRLFLNDDLSQKEKIY